MFAYQSSCSYNSRVKKSVDGAQRESLLILLREMRAEAGLTQAQLAERLGTDQTFVSKYETGERRLDVLEVREVCQAMGIPFTSFARRLESELK